MLVHPGAASIDCGECAKYVYNLKTGERETYDAGDEMLPILRGDGETPCDSCPKKSPEEGEQLKQSQGGRLLPAHEGDAQSDHVQEAARLSCGSKELLLDRPSDEGRTIRDQSQRHRRSSKGTQS